MYLTYWDRVGKRPNTRSTRFHFCNAACMQFVEQIERLDIQPLNDQIKLNSPILSSVSVLWKCIWMIDQSNNFTSTIETDHNDSLWLQQKPNWYSTNALYLLAVKKRSHTSDRFAQISANQQWFNDMDTVLYFRRVQEKILSCNLAKNNNFSVCVCVCWYMHRTQKSSYLRRPHISSLWRSNMAHTLRFEKEEETIQKVHTIFSPEPRLQRLSSKMTLF